MNKEQGRDIVLVARDTWSGLWRRRQYLASEFSRTSRVLFTERPYSLPRLLVRGSETTSRPATRILRGALGAPVEARQNIFVTAPVKPFPNHPDALRDVNRAAEASHMRRALKSLGMDSPILWLNPEYSVWLPDELPHSLVVYDVTDDWTEADLDGRERDEIIQNDRLMLERADIVFTVSHDLYRKKSPFNPNTHFMPNGVDADMYSPDVRAPRPPELEGIPGPIAGYTGSLHSDRIDPDLIEFLAKHGNFTQVFVGPDFLRPDLRRRLHTLPNTAFIPTQPYHKLPAFLQAFDVCTIPHVVSPFTNSLDPIKAYEYLASGKPVVSVAVDGVLPLAAHIDIADGYEDYLAKVRKAIAGGGKSDAESRIFAARQHSWRQRAADIFTIIGETLEKKRSGG